MAQLLSHYGTVCFVFFLFPQASIMARYKKLCTFPNILLSDLSVVDFLNAFINMPLFFLVGVVEGSWFKEMVLAITVLYFSQLFALHLVSMLVLLVNIFLALTFDLRNFTWRTNEKAFATVLVEWLTP